MPIVYLLIIFGVFIIIGLFWFLQNNQHSRSPMDIPGMFPKGSANDILLLSGLRKVDMFADKGKWLLFLAVFLLLIEFFIFISYFIRNAGVSLNLSGVEHLYFLGGLFYFFLTMGAIFISMRLTSIAREFPQITDGFAWPRAVWEQRVNELSAEQKSNLAYFVNEKNHALEQSYSTALILVSSAATILLIWLAYWLFTHMA